MFHIIFGFKEVIKSKTIGRYLDDNTDVVMFIIILKY